MYTTQNVIYNANIIASSDKNVPSLIEIEDDDTVREVPCKVRTYCTYLRPVEDHGLLAVGN
jgi:hypothetical protein